MELFVAAAFAVVSRELLETGADPRVLRIVARADDDEIEHARICLDVASRYRGSKEPWPAGRPLVVPDYKVDDDRLRAALHLVALSCLNETIASVRLGETLRETESPVVKSAIHAILEDEVQHARAGWAHLASAHVTPALKSEVAWRLPAMIRVSIEGTMFENAHIPEMPAHGLPTHASTKRVALATVRDVVTPGFASVGIQHAPFDATP
jgi:hypothetical protein